MIQRYRDGVIPGVNREATGAIEDELVQTIGVASARVELAMSEYHPQEALAAIWEIVTRANAYVEVTAPWQIAKSEREETEPPGRLDTVLSALAITLSRIAYLLEPFLPETSRKITDQLGGDTVGATPIAGQRVEQPQPIFPRFEEG